MQSAYHAHHSTETALVKVKSDILKAMDNQEIVCLTLLDLSAAYNMISKDKLLTWLGGRIWNHQHLSQVDRVISDAVHTESCSWQFQVRSCYPDIWCASGISSRTNTVYPIYISLG